MHISNHKPIQLILLLASIPLSLPLQGCEGLTPTYADIESRGEATVAGANRSMSIPSQAACDAGLDLTQPLLTSQDLDNAGQSGAPSVAMQASRKEVKILLDSLRMQHGERFWECRLQLPSKSKKSDTKLETGSVDTRVTQRTHRTTDQDHNLDANYVSFKYYIRPGFQHSDPIKIVPSLRIYQWQADEKSFTCIEPPINTDLSIHPGEIFYGKKSTATFFLDNRLTTFVFHFGVEKNGQPDFSSFPIDNFSTVGLLEHQPGTSKLFIHNTNRLNVLHTLTRSPESIGAFQGELYHNPRQDGLAKVLQLKQAVIQKHTLDEPNLSNEEDHPIEEDSSLAAPVHLQSHQNTFKRVSRIALSRPFLMLTASGITLLLCKSYYAQS